MDSYSRKDIVELTKLPSRLVRFYTEEGLVKPEVEVGEGRGKVRRYSKKNLRQFRLIKALTKFGIKLEILKLILTDLPTAPLERDNLEGKYYLKIKSHPDGRLQVGMDIRGYRAKGPATDTRGKFYKTHVVHSVDDFKDFPTILTIDLEGLFRDL